MVILTNMKSFKGLPSLSIMLHISQIAVTLKPNSDIPHISHVFSSGFDTLEIYGETENKRLMVF